MLERMARSNVVRALILTGLGAAAMATSQSHASDAKVRKASDWLGHAVTTRDGKELGTVRDFAIDERSGKVVYVVVSVGSFLIENNLIAVAPDALAPSRANDNVLELDADPDALVRAQRFASDSRWPAKADVLRGNGHAIASSGGAAEVAPDNVTPSPTGSATIESHSKTAHLSASERYVKDAAPAPPVVVKPAPAKSASKQARLEPITKFDRLDVDGDGVLNRSEFAPVMSRGDRYGKVDANADGVIEPQEFDAHEQAHSAAN